MASRSIGYKLQRSLGFLLAFGATFFAHNGLLAQGPGLQFVNHANIYGNSQGSDPRWNGGTFIVYDPPGPRPVVYVTSLDGTVRNITLTIPTASRVGIRSVATGPGGQAVICGFAESFGGHSAGYVALVGSGGDTQKIIQTDPFQPTAAAMAPDGSIWLKGTIHDVKNGNPIRKTTEGVIRHLDKAGNVLAGFIPTSSLTAPELFGLGDFQYLVATADRVGWYSGKGAKYYFEITTSGQINKFPALQGVDRIGGLAITSGGNVFVTAVKDGVPATIYTLDRAREQWFAIPPAPSQESTPYILGSYGNSIALKSTRSPGMGAELFNVQ